jgi:hypothetical protein
MVRDGEKEGRRKGEGKARCLEDGALALLLWLLDGFRGRSTFLCFDCGAEEGWEEGREEGRKR